MFLLALLLALLLAEPPAAAQESAGPPLREQELLSLVRSKALFTDEQVCEMVQSRGIGFRLTDSVRKALKKEGASAALLAAVEKAAEEMKHRTTATEAAAAAAAAPKPVPLPPPLDEAQQARLLEQVRQHALEYSEKLPNFICVQVTKRVVDFEGKGYWQTQDVIQARLAYNEHRESYQVVAINDQLTDRSYDSLGGATSTGEFASMLRDLFLPETEAHFDWVGPAILRGRPVYTYDYRVVQPRSHWQIVWDKRRASERAIVPAYRGRIVVDAENHELLRLSTEAEDIPADFPIRAAFTTLDYDYATISGRSFLLPARAVVEMRESRIATRNEISFRQYRRFTAETKLVFDETPPPK